MKEYNRSEFVKDLISAIEEAEAIPKVRNSPEPIFQKLHFDFPVVTVAELALLENSFIKGVEFAKLNNRFLEVVHEGAFGCGCPSSSDGPPRSDVLAAAYQRLYAIAILSTLHRVLTGQICEAQAHLHAVHPPSNSGADFDGGPAGVDMPAKVVYLTERVHVVLGTSLEGVWRDGSVNDAISICLAALCRHPLFWQLLPALTTLCLVVYDRVISCDSAEAVSRGLKMLQEALDSAGFGHADAEVDDKRHTTLLLLLNTAASLSSRLRDASARRQLFIWTIDATEQCGRLLEFCEQQSMTRGKKCSRLEETKERGHDAFFGREDAWHAMVAVARLVEFCVLEAPRSKACLDIPDNLLTTGVFRSLIMSLLRKEIDINSEPLVRSVLLCCSSSSKLRDWANAVPGYSSALHNSQSLRHGKLRLYGALFATLTSSDHNDEETIAACITVVDVATLETTLQIMSAMHACHGRFDSYTPSMLWGSKTLDALSSASKSLRKLSCSVEQHDAMTKSKVDIGGDGRGGAAMESEAIQTDALMARQTRLLRPECLRMIKLLMNDPEVADKSH
jgi:hypothetical protein